MNTTALTTQILTGPNAKELPITTFCTQVNKTHSCWLWQGKQYSNGYGCFRTKQQEYLAHRVAYFFHTGVTPNGVVMHSCDNKLCVNPAHLSVGSQSDNMQDMLRKKRNNPPRGEKSAQAKLTETQVRSIITSTKSTQELAQHYNVSLPQIRRIKSGTRWSHIYKEYAI